YNDGGNIERPVMRHLSALFHVAHDDGAVVGAGEVDRIGSLVLVALRRLFLRLRPRAEEAVALVLAGGRDAFAALDPVRTPGGRVDRRLQAFDELGLEAGADGWRHRLDIGERPGLPVELFGRQ